MSTLNEILVAIDDSEASAPAADYARRLAKVEDAHLTFCNAVDITGTIARCTTPYVVSDVAPVLEALEEECRSILHKAKAEAKAYGVAAEALELAGPAVPAVVELAATRHVSAIVMGSHGRHGASRLFLGSTAEGVLRRTDIPVFIVSQAEVALPPNPLDRILVALDDSDPADAAIEFALDLAHPHDTTIVLTHVVALKALHQLATTQHYPAENAFSDERLEAQEVLTKAAERVRARGIPVETILLDGTPIDEITHLASSQSASLVVIGTHGRRGLRRLFLGSVAEGVVRDSPVPVAVVRRHAVVARRQLDDVRDADLMPA